MKHDPRNNRGSVGKTFLRFAAASEYARQDPRIHSLQGVVLLLLLAARRSGLPRLD